MTSPKQGAATPGPWVASQLSDSFGWAVLSPNNEMIVRYHLRKEDALLILRAVNSHGALAMSGMLADSSRGGHVATYAKDAVAAADGLLAALTEARP